MYLASISTSSGATLPWANHPTSPILDIARYGQPAVRRHGWAGRHRAGLRRGSGSRIWYYMTDGNVQAVTTVNGWPVFGMHGDYVAPRVNSKLSEYGKSDRISRHKVFSCLPTARCSSGRRRWRPSRACWACGRSTARRGTLEVGGDFTKVDGAPQARFAIFPLQADARERGLSPSRGTARTPFRGNLAQRQGSQDFRVCCLEPISLVIARGRGHHHSNGLRRLHRTCSPCDFRVDGHPQSRRCALTATVATAASPAAAIAAAPPRIWQPPT